MNEALENICYVDFTINNCEDSTVQFGDRLTQCCDIKESRDRSPEYSKPDPCVQNETAQNSLVHPQITLWMSTVGRTNPQGTIMF